MCKIILLQGGPSLNKNNSNRDPLSRDFSIFNYFLLHWEATSKSRNCMKTLKTYNFKKKLQVALQMTNFEDRATTLPPKRMNCVRGGSRAGSVTNKEGSIGAY